MLIQREMDQDAMLWETPTIALTAQAFLLTIALNRDSTAPAVYISAALGVIVAVLSMQLMAKHRFLNEMDRAQLHRLEEELDIPHISRRSYFFPSGKYAIPHNLSTAGRSAPKKQGLLQSIRSYNFWVLGLGIFAAVNVAILAIELWWPTILHPPTL
ncbi:hypothetical protein [Arthrobacter alpinus]|uniref:hypothetical protein n=1 Tax=Arthrobacter alpinus TaxID=656366 RepID=UPI000783D653|nr:hypothetical protein [Arthrobacter alpinus]